MRVNSLNLVNFRNFKERSFDFKEGINLITAPNGSGKTNILEAVRIMCYGKPIFISRETDIINFENVNSELPFCKVVLNWQDREIHDSTYTLSPTIKPTKSLVIDNHKKMQKNFIGKFSAVWFSPETINIITASPRHRRELLDIYFSQLSEDYVIALSNYEKALEARNRVLKSPDKNNISFLLKKYNPILAKNAVELIEIKYKLSRNLYNYVKTSSLKQDRYEITWIYEPNVTMSKIFNEDLEKTILFLLEESEIKDIVSKRTNVGPHRDNWTINLIDKNSEIKSIYDLRHYGSRGQKRMGLLIFTLAIVELLEKYKGSKPILLLDDVVSELDDENVGLILHMLNNKEQQSIITSTHDNIEGLEKVNVIRLES